MEVLNLNVPEVVPAITTTDYRVSSLLIDVEGARIVVRVTGTNGERKEFTYLSATALISALNKADMSVKSLQRRILEKLSADGKLPGAVAGQPD